MSGDFQKKNEVLFSSNSKLEKEVDALKIQLQVLKGEKERVISDRDNLAAAHQRDIEVSYGRFE